MAFTQIYKVWKVGVAKWPGSTFGLWPDRSDRFGRWYRTLANIVRPGQWAKQNGQIGSGQWKRTCSVSTCSLTVTALMPTRLNADHGKWQHVAAVLHGQHTANNHLAIGNVTWLSIQSFGIPVVRHSNTRCASRQMCKRWTFELLYIDYQWKRVQQRPHVNKNSTQFTALPLIISSTFTNYRNTALVHIWPNLTKLSRDVCTVCIPVTNTALVSNSPRLTYMMLEENPCSGCPKRYKGPLAY